MNTRHHLMQRLEPYLLGEFPTEMHDEVVQRYGDLLVCDWDDPPRWLRDGAFALLALLSMERDTYVRPGARESEVTP